MERKMNEMILLLLDLLQKILQNLQHFQKMNLQNFPILQMMNLRMMNLRMMKLNFQR